MAPPVGYLAKLLDNQNFVKWFGKSAVRDWADLPLEVYHGTANSFDEFRPTNLGAGSRESGLGHWFTENTSAANNFAEFARPEEYGKSGASVIPGHLSMENPWKPGSYDEIRDLVDRHTQFFRKENFGGRNIRMRDDKVDHAAAVKELRDKGFDGIFLEKTMVDAPDGLPINQYISFSPTQFKSRFNRGTFSPDDPNFLKSLAPVAGGGLLAAMMTPQESQAADMGIGPGALARMQRGQYNDTAHAQALDSEPIVDPVGMFVNAATGGGGYLARGIQAATDPLVNWMFK